MLEKHWNRFSAGALPQTPLGSSGGSLGHPIIGWGGENSFFLPKDNPLPGHFPLWPKSIHAPTLSWNPEYASGLGVFRLLDISRVGALPPKLSKHMAYTGSPMFETSQQEAFCDAWKALKSVFGRDSARPAEWSSQHSHRLSSRLVRGTVASSRAHRTLLKWYEKHALFLYHFSGNIWHTPGTFNVNDNEHNTLKVGLLSGEAQTISSTQHMVNLSGGRGYAPDHTGELTGPHHK